MKKFWFYLLVIMIIMMSSKSDAKKDNVDLTIDFNGKRVLDSSDSSKDVRPALRNKRGTLETRFLTQ